jgi:glycerol-3-phosphate O-acyltransferase
LSRWVRVTVKPEGAAAAIAARPHAVCYVLECESITDSAVLDSVCRRLGMPSPERRLTVSGQRLGKACIELTRRTRFLNRRTAARGPRYLTALVAAAATHPEFDLDLVPVAIFFGRAPHKEVSLWRLLFAEHWGLAGRFRKLLNVAFNGRNTLVYFGEPLALREGVDAGLSDSRTVRRLLRSLRVSLRAQRTSTIGPDLSHRRTLVAHILNTQAVRQAVRQEMQTRPRAGRPLKRRAVLLMARRHALEIAANYSTAFITFMSLLLGRLWNWLYDGVEFEHVDKLTEIGDGAEIIYVPCHRSHMDYLLLSYVIYRKGFAIPHVAAGANLNLPVIGRLLRKGGAFFLRRSFKGDPLYAAVFMKYLEFMMARGHPLEYFIEGGRSRSGRLLSPRTGMLSMTVHSFVRDPKRPVVFMPVYFGYERIAEGRTYIGELSGRPKEKESLFGLVKASVAVLRSRFGKVHVNLGEPIALDALLRRHHPHWRREAAGNRDPRNEHAPGDHPPAGWLRAAIADLAHRILQGINEAAAVTPVNVVAMAMLATPRQALPEAALQSQLELYQQLLAAVPYSPLVTITGEDGAAMIRYAVTMGMLERQKHPLGDIMRMNETQAVLATYYRNNVLHLFAMPSLIACGFISNTRLRTADLQRLVWRVYPYIAAELFLRWDEGEIGPVVDSLLDAFVRLRLLEVDEERREWQRPAPTSLAAMKLSLLAEPTLQTLERYYLVVALLLQAGPGAIGQQALEQRCHLMAQRMSVLYGQDSPEFFDKSLFRNFIDLLRSRAVVQTAREGNLLFGDALLDVAADAQLVLSEQIRHSILQVTLA